MNNKTNLGTPIFKEVESVRQSGTFTIAYIGNTREINGRNYVTLFNAKGSLLFKEDEVLNNDLKIGDKILITLSENGGFGNFETKLE